MTWLIPLQRQPNDEEPLYDTLRPSNQKPPLTNDYYGRVRSSQRVTRESVVQFADNLMEKGIEQSLSASPEPVDHTIEAYSSMVQMQFATSSNVPDTSKPYMAQSLSAKKSRHDRAESEPRNFSASAKTDIPSTPVHVSTLRGLFAQPSMINPMQPKLSIMSHSSPHSPVEKTMPSDTSVVTSSAGLLHGDNKDEQSPLERTNSARGKAKLRPSSWDSSLLFQGDGTGDWKPQEDDYVFSGNKDPFSRDSNLRTPVKRSNKSNSRGDLTVQEPDDRFLFDKDEPLMSPSVTDSLYEPSSAPRTPDGSVKPASKPLVSVKERTKKWEERGGVAGSSTQAHLATLPRPVKKRSSTSNIPTTGSSTSGIPVRVKSPSSVSSLQPAVMTKPHPTAEPSESNSVLNAQEQQLPSGTKEESSGEEAVAQKKETSVPLIRTVGDVSSSHSMKNMSTSKLRGQSLLPTKTPIPVRWSCNTSLLRRCHICQLTICIHL